MPTLSASELDRLVVSVGITDPSARAIAVAIALTESGGQTGATHRNTDKFRSIDYGLWQINGHWHPSYDTHKLLTASYNATAMAAISSNGTSWGAWTTFQSGRYQGNLDKAKKAVAANLAGTAAGALSGTLSGGVAAGIGNPVGGLVDAVGNVVGAAGSLLDPAGLAGSVLGTVFGNWQRDIFGMVLGGVFVIAALAIAAIGLSQLSGVDSKKVMDTAGTAAQAAALAA